MNVSVAVDRYRPRDLVLPDLLAVGVEFFIAETERHPSEQPDYLIGEDVLKPGGIRSACFIRVAKS